MVNMRYINKCRVKLAKLALKNKKEGKDEKNLQIEALREQIAAAIKVGLTDSHVSQIRDEMKQITQSG